jgi:hypothetical protein
MNRDVRISLARTFPLGLIRQGLELFDDVLGLTEALATDRATAKLVSKVRESIISVRTSPERDFATFFPTGYGCCGLGVGAGVGTVMKSPRARMNFLTACTGRIYRSDRFRKAHRGVAAGQACCSSRAVRVADLTARNRRLRSLVASRKNSGMMCERTILRSS